MNKLQILRDEAAVCVKCPLNLNRNKSVFDSGNASSEIVFVGEAGGKDENAQGTPFIGRAGKLLNSMIQAMGLTRDEVYVTNVCKCAPPGNRKPEPSEMEACKPFLHQQMQIVKPKVVITLGATATEAVLGPGLGITKRRGIWGEWNGTKIMPTLHPAYILRNPSAKTDVVKDLREVLKFLGKVP